MLPPPRTVDADSSTRRLPLVAGVVIGAVFIPIGFGIGLLAGLSGVLLLLCALLVGAAAGGGVWWLSRSLSEGAGRAFGAFVQPSGVSTPYEREFSHLQALAVRGQVAEALDGYEAEIARDAAGVAVRLQAADLHARSGDRDRALSLFAEVRRLTTSRATELYATQRLIDVHLAPGGDDGRALTELRRLVDRFPDTPEADGARGAIERLKGLRGTP